MPLPVFYVALTAVDGVSAYDVIQTRGEEEVTVAHIRYDRWTATWALLHPTGLIERFDTLLGARSGAHSSYG